jgi:hypothetical protein
MANLEDNPELFGAAASIVQALAVRLLDLSQALRARKRTADIARHCERLVRMSQAALREITPSVRQLARLRQ